MDTQPTETTAPVERLAFTISEFCAAHGLGRSTYYQLKKRGQTPDEIRVGRVPLITVEAARTWRRKHSKHSNQG
jgi:hypothetical protein